MSREDIIAVMTRGLRVMSFNLRGALTPDGWNVWPLRASLVREVLDRHRPQVVAFQEMLAPNAWLLRRSLRGYQVVRGVATGRRLIGPRNALYIARDLVVTGRGGFWLGRRPERFGADWGARQARGATWVRLRHGGGEVLVVDTHLDHESAEARTEGARLVRERLRGLGWPAVPAIVCGDFNASAGGADHATWLADGFRDTWTDTGHRDGLDVFTFHAFRGQPDPAELRIDWILYSPPLRPRAAAIVRDARPPRYPSDHYPVMADFE